jgi:hypothetical protein
MLIAACDSTTVFLSECSTDREYPARHVLIVSPEKVNRVDNGATMATKMAVDLKRIWLGQASSICTIIGVLFILA